MVLTQVVHLREADDFTKTGQWEALIRDKVTNVERTEMFDAVLVCTGHHAKKYMPHFDGEENFKRIKIHSHDFHDSRGYDDKRVVIIGMGNSAGDTAVELSRICSQVNDGLSLRSCISGETLDPRGQFKNYKGLVD